MITKASIVLASLFTFLVGYNLGYQQYNDDFKQVMTNGITFRWKIEGGMMHCQVQAPAEGWVGVGFKPTGGLIQANFLMGAYRDGSSFCEDHSVVALGNYPEVTDLGGTPAIEACDVMESNGTTEFHFSIPTDPMDGYHYQFIEGEKMFVTLAYSRSDDFTHHSVVRIQMELEL